MSLWLLITLSYDTDRVSRKKVSILQKQALNMPVTIKGKHVYFQPVQGDINFLVNTEFFQRKILKPIAAWKSPATTPLAMTYLKKQDEQKGFLAYAEKITGKTLL